MFVKALLTFALFAMKSADEFIRKGVKNPVLLQFLLGLTRPVEDSLEALLDKNPDDEKQILEIARKYANTTAVPFAQAEWDKIEARIQNEQLRILAGKLSEIPFSAALIYTDELPENENQLETYIEGFISSKENQDILIKQVLLPIIAQRTGLDVNSPTVTFVLNLLTGQLAGAEINIDIDGDGQ